MAGDNQREDVFRVVDELHWIAADKPGKNGYLKLKCPCGKHMKWLHKTPSNPNYYRDTIKWLRRQCDQRETTDGSDRPSTV